MKILFLDDSPARQEWATKHFPGHDLIQPTTAAAAIDILEHDGPFDLVHLDHDLGGETYAESSRADTGFEVVRWIVREKPTIPEIVVHSRNAPAGHRMTATLRKAGYAARYQAFDRMVDGLPAKQWRSTPREGHP